MSIIVHQPKKEKHNFEVRACSPQVALPPHVAKALQPSRGRPVGIAEKWEVFWDTTMFYILDLKMVYIQCIPLLNNLSKYGKS